MIKGKIQRKFITAEDVLGGTTGGYDVYMLYLGKVRRQMDRPWGKKEKKPSWGIYPYGGLWFWKDHATEETGNAIQFVEKQFGLTFSEARDRIAWDFGIGGQEVERKKIVTWEAPYAEDKEFVRMNFTKQSFLKQHHDFWNIVEVSESHLEKLNYFAVKDLAIQGRRVYIRPGEAVFAFYCPEEDGVKIYFPERDKGEKFRNNVSYHHLWHYDELEECENLIVQKSNKDLAVTKMITPCVISTQAEGIKIFNEETVSRINTITKSPWVWYGSDSDGVKKCKGITDTNKWKYLNTPKNLLPLVNDTYSIVKMWNTEKMGTGLKKLEEFMKLKKVI